MAYTTNLTLGARVAGGQHGDLYEGRDPVHGKVAVKVLKRDQGELTTEWAARSAALVGEAQRLKAAHHPNIVEVFDVVKDSTNDVVHLVTEFCDCGSVETLYNSGPLSIQRTRKIITDACRGLEHIHSCGMIHRDIKPGNILQHGNTYKIGDFGLVSDNLVVGYASADGYIAHLAPEVFGNPTTGVAGITSRKTDVWALGMTAYRLLSGHQHYIRNFAGMTAADVRQMIMSGGFVQRLLWLPHIPDAWRKFIRKAMHDDTTHRFPTALEMSQSMANLPITPAWSCTYTSTSVEWTHKEGPRTINVTWKIHSPRRHEWFAVRTGGGKRDVSAGGEVGKIISSSQTNDELQAFFSNWT